MSATTLNKGDAVHEAILHVAILEDDHGLRRSMVDIIGKGQNLRCVGDFESAESALEQIPVVQPHIMFVDIHLPGTNGVGFVREAIRILPASKFVMLTVHDDTNAIFDSLAAGATGYLVKPVRAAQLLAAIEDVQTGGAPMTSHIARKVVQAFHKPPAASFPPNEGLSDRETEVLDYLAKGFLYKEIASKMNVSYNTVHTFVARIYQKLQVRSRSQAVAKYLDK